MRDFAVRYLFTVYGLAGSVTVAVGLWIADDRAPAGALLFSAFLLGAVVCKAALPKEQDS